MSDVPSPSAVCRDGLWAIDKSALERLIVAQQTLRALSPGVTYGRRPKSVDVTAGGVGVLKISGVLERLSSIDNAINLIDETTYQEIAAALETAAADPAVRSIALHFDSPGGSAVGLSLAAEAIQAAAKKKTVYAYTDGMMASAAYFLGSQADRIFTSSEALIGSIGTVWAMYDISGLLAKWGIKLELFSSGPHKGAGTPGSTLNDEQRAEFQRLVDAFAADFVQAVASGRGVSEAKAKEWATGQVWLGRQAVDLGLADQVMSFAQMVALLEQSPPKQTGAIAMSTTATNPAAAAVTPPAAAAPAVDPLAAERQRVADIQAAFPDDAAFAMKAVAGGWSVTEAKAHYSDVLRERMKQSQIAVLETDGPPGKGQQIGGFGALKTPAVRPLGGHAGGAPAASGEGGDGSEFDARVREVMADNKCARLEAVQIAARRFPDAHRDYLLATNSGSRQRRLVSERFEQAAT